MCVAGVSSRAFLEIKSDAGIRESKLRENGEREGWSGSDVGGVKLRVDWYYFYWDSCSLVLREITSLFLLKIYEARRIYTQLVSKKNVYRLKFDLVYLNIHKIFYHPFKNKSIKN